MIIEEYTQVFESRISVGATEKLPGCGKHHAKMVAWSCDIEGHAQKMRWEILRTGKQKDGAVAQSFKPLLGWSSIQEGGLNQLENYQKYGGKLSWNVCTWHEMVDLTFLVRDPTCSSSHQMDTSLWQTFGKINFIHSSHKWLPTILSCG